MKNKKMFGKIEYIFDILYLITIFTMGIYYLTGSSYEYAQLLGITALLLGFGDSFHLIPRILSIMKDDATRYYKALGIGKMITSISMTIVYVLLWQMILKYTTIPQIYTYIIYGLAGIRIIFCLLPNNHWIDNKSSDKWNIVRNIPFMIIGVMVIVGFYMIKDLGFSYMWILVIFSFLFYIPVVLYSKKIPKIGMLMLPKSCMYIWIIALKLFV